MALSGELCEPPLQAEFIGPQSDDRKGRRTTIWRLTGIDRMAIGAVAPAVAQALMARRARVIETLFRPLAAAHAATGPPGCWKGLSRTGKARRLAGREEASSMQRLRCASWAVPVISIKALLRR